MVSAPREREGAPSPWDAPWGTLGRPWGPSLQAADSLLGCGPLVPSGSVEAAGCLGVSSGHAEVPPGSQGNTGKARVAPTCHPVPGLATWKTGKRRKRLLALRRVHQGCQALGILNLRCECAQFSLGVCSYGNALLWADLSESQHRAASRGRSHSQHVCGFSFACTSPGRPGLASSPCEASGVASQPWLVVSPLVKEGLRCCEGIGRQWFSLKLDVPHYRFCLMLYFLPKDLDGNQRIERKISCHLQDCLSLSPTPRRFSPQLSELVLFLNYYYYFLKSLCFHVCPYLKNHTAMKRENTINQFKNYIHDGILSKKRKNPFDDFYILNYNRLCISRQSKGENVLSLKMM